MILLRSMLIGFLSVVFYIILKLVETRFEPALSMVELLILDAVVLFTVSWASSGSLMTWFCRMSKRMSRSETMFKLLVDSAPDGVYVQSGGKFLYMNKAMAAILGGKRPDHFIGGNIFKHISARYHEVVRSRIEEQIRSNDPVPSMRQEYLRLDGSAVVVETTAVRIDFDGMESHLVFVRDVSRQAEADRLLVEAKEKAEEASRIKNEFLSNISHEIRTPLNAVIGFSDMLIGTKLDQEQREFVSIIRGRGMDLLSLLNDVIDIAKMEAGCFHLEMQDINVADLLNDSIEMIRPVADAKGLEVRLELDQSARRTLYCDRIRMRQMLWNLLGNAVKFTDRGSVSLKAFSEGGLLRILVRDTGIGIDRSKFDWIFHYFGQADGSATRRYGGTGLGLAICRNIVERMGGSISVESQVGVGSEFVVSLPIRDIGVSAVIADAPDTDRRKGVVLVVDDDGFTLAVCKTMLGKMGYSVDCATNGKDAVIMCRNMTYSVILTDIMMPEMSGMELLKKLRLVGYGGVVAAMTACSMSGTRPGCLKRDSIIICRSRSPKRLWRRFWRR